MKITSKQLRAIRNHIIKTLKLEVQFEENEVKKNGLYADIIYKGTHELSRPCAFRANCDLILKILAPGGNFDDITARIMTADSNIDEIAFKSEEVVNPEQFQKVDAKLWYGIIWTDEEAERELEGNKLTYQKTYELQVIIGA